MRMINNSVFCLIAGILISTLALEQIPSQKGLRQSILEINSAPKSGNFNSSDFLISLKNDCVKTPIVENYIDQLSNSIEPSMKPEEPLGSNSINMTLLLLKFICEDDGARIDKFITDGGQKCMDSNKKSFLDCSKEFSSRYSPATEKATPFTRYPDGNYDCPNIAKLQLCLFKVFNNCEHHTPADIVDALFDSMKKDINCENLYTSEASESSVFNVIVITIVMAIFSRF